MCVPARMAEGAALLVDHVLPAVGYRQWVLSFSGPLAVRLGYERGLEADGGSRPRPAPAPNPEKTSRLDSARTRSHSSGYGADRARDWPPVVVAARERAPSALVESRGVLSGAAAPI